MPTPAAEEQRRALGDFLRARRARMSPAEAGIDWGSRRRTPGLRREELAQLSGLSVTWYTWIEQGRGVSASPQALARLAAALRLTPAERAYLFDLAGRRDPSLPRRAPASAAPQGLWTAVAAIRVPAYVLDRCWNAVAWNAPAGRLFAGWLDRPADGMAERNLLRFIFLDRSARRLIRPWEERARRVLAEFRAEFGSAPDDPGLAALVEDLRGRSADFARFWEEHAVLAREGGLRQFNHPKRGLRSYQQIGFALAGHPELKLVMLLDSGTPPRAGPRLLSRPRATSGL